MCIERSCEPAKADDRPELRSRTSLEGKSAWSDQPAAPASGKFLLHDVNEPGPYTMCTDQICSGRVARPIQRLHRHRSKRLGGAGRDRTDDLKLAKLALSQLSYGPDRRWRYTRQAPNNGGPG